MEIAIWGIFEVKMRGWTWLRCIEYINIYLDDFRPQIDKNSRRITKQMVGKVEDRLIDYGERLKVKKAEMETIYEEELHQRRNASHNVDSI